MRAIATILLLLLAFSVCPAATWHVAKDGSGDFTVIQDAIDAASPGDEIWIHAGRYTEMTEAWDVWGDGSFYADCHVVITKDDLTLRGDGADATIIGFSEPSGDPGPNYTGINVTYHEAATLVLRDLAVENVDRGVYAYCPGLSITSCRLEGNDIGIRLLAETASTIADCAFSECHYGVVSFSPTENLAITGSEFSDVGVGCICINSDNVTISDCQYTGCTSAIDFQQGTTGVIEDVVAIGYENYGVKLVMGAYAEITDSRFEGGVSGIISHGEGLVCLRTGLIGQSYQAVDVNSDGNTSFSECDIINGGEWSIYCRYNGSGDCHLDATNCYWGTDSEDQIAEWIFDSNDDPGRCCTVDFIPFEGTVATEPRSWSAVKGLFEVEE